MAISQITKRDLGFTLLVSSLLLGGVPSKADVKEPTEVGSEESNVDKDSTSGSYYPYSAGTVGDDPAEPTSTSVPADAGESHPGPTDHWGDTADSDGDGYLSLAELTKVAPALSGSFDEMDVDGDGKLTRGEFRTWHESHKTQVSTDEASRSITDDRSRTSAERSEVGGR